MYTMILLASIGQLDSSSAAYFSMSNGYKQEQLQQMPRDEKLKRIVAMYNANLKRPAVDAAYHSAHDRLDKKRQAECDAAIKAARAEIEKLGLTPSKLAWRQIEADIMREYSR